MVSIEKAYKGAFVLDRSKMTRLVSVINESFRETNVQCMVGYEAHIGAAKIIKMSAIDEVFDLDNSKRNHIRRLTIEASSDTAESVAGEYYCKIDFNGSETPADVTVIVKSVDTGWGYELMSLLEEQVERTLQHSVVHRFKGSTSFELLVSLLTVAGLLIAVMTLLIPGSRAKQDTMWLTQTDISELQKALDDSSFITEPQMWMADLYKRQIRNLSAPAESTFQKWVGDWRLLFIIAPALIILAVFIYLFSKCYPFAVFLWGDCEEWYEAILERRKMLWTVVVISMVIGVISNMFVFGLSAFIGP
jgi:hypothetical protein